MNLRIAAMALVPLLAGCAEYCPYPPITTDGGASTVRLVGPAPALPVSQQSFIVFFDWDKAALTPEGAHVVDEFVKYYHGGGRTGRILVVGHADRSGSDRYNVGLSERRANTVRKALQDRGVNTAGIEIEWKGERQPLTPTADGVREPTNRRAEIYTGL